MQDAQRAILVRVLFVSGGNRGVPMPFVAEQAESLRSIGVWVEHFLISGHGIRGYLRNLPSLVGRVKNSGVSLVHAHYGLAGMLAVLQRVVPVIVTFHGSDIMRVDHRQFSRVAGAMARSRIFVSSALRDRFGGCERDAVIPCGVDLERFQEIERECAISRLGWRIGLRYVLFAGSFGNSVKCPGLARAAVEGLRREDVRLVELRGFDRDGVALALNACDGLLLTSIWEGSPQIVKEAMACGRPVVATKVGDVAELLEGVTSCRVVASEASELCEALTGVVGRDLRTDGRRRIEEMELSLDAVAARVKETYWKAMGRGRRGQ